MSTTPKPTERDYQLLKKPLVTEKTAKLSEQGWYTFEVALDATKPELKAALQRLYAVDVAQVNTLIRKGKSRASRAGIIRRSDRKHAFFKLKAGQSIDLTQGVK